MKGILCKMSLLSLYVSIQYIDIFIKRKYIAAMVHYHPHFTLCKWGRSTFVKESQYISIKMDNFSSIMCLGCSTSSPRAARICLGTLFPSCNCSPQVPFHSAKTIWTSLFNSINDYLSNLKWDFKIQKRVYFLPYRLFTVFLYCYTPFPRPCGELAGTRRRNRGHCLYGHPLYPPSSWIAGALWRLVRASGQAVYGCILCTQ